MIAPGSMPCRDVAPVRLRMHLAGLRQLRASAAEMSGVPPRKPEWDQQILPSGLIIATSAAPRPTDRVELPPDLRPPRPALLLPAGVVPQPSDMLPAAPSTSDLGYPTATLAEVIDLLEEVPFEPAMLLA